MNQAMESFYSLVQQVKDPYVKDMFFGWASEHIVELSIEHGEDFGTPSEYARLNAEKSFMELGKSLLKNSEATETKFWTTPNKTKITRHTVSILK